MSGSDDASLLPPKRDVALALIQTAASVYVHLDPRPEAVQVPSWFKNQPELVLQVGLNLVPPIVDLDIGAEGLSATLSFNRRPEFCQIPWSAVWGLVGADGRGMIWPESVPPEVAARAPGRGSGGAKAGAGDKPRKRGGHLRAASSSETAGSSARKGEPPGPKADPPETKAPQQTPAPAAERGEAPGAGPKAEQPTTPTSRKRELPPYLRVVK